jgi:hypothetical protein
MRRVSQNSQLLKIIMCRPFAHTEVNGNKTWKTQIATCSHASVQHGWHCAEFYETRNEQQMLVDIFSIQLYPNRKISVENMQKM